VTNQSLQNLFIFIEHVLEQRGPSELLQTALHASQQLFGCDKALLLRADPDSGISVYYGDTKGGTFSSSAVQQVISNQKPLLISDTVSDEALSMQQSIISANIKSIMAGYIDTASNTILYLDSAVKKRPFSAEDLRDFSHICSILQKLFERVSFTQQQSTTIQELKAQLTQELIYESESMAELISHAQRAAAVDAPVLIHGETGTGKEVLARLLHRWSNRASKPFFAINCGALPHNLIGSYLFGHAKGAFTGAVDAKKGYFEQANGGTLFLDEIGDLPLELQSAFLRVLQQSEVTPLGSTRTISVDVRILAATHVDLAAAVEQKRFREDLYYRLNVIPLAIPPLRMRGKDSLLLANAFLKRYSADFSSRQILFSADCEKKIVQYPWPGNVRELQNRVQRAIISNTSGTITAEQLQIEQQSHHPTHRSLRQQREELERDLVSEAITRFPDNMTQAAKYLDIDRKSLRMLVKKYKIVSK